MSNELAICIDCSMTNVGDPVIEKKSDILLVSGVILSTSIIYSKIPFFYR